MNEFTNDNNLQGFPELETRELTLPDGEVTVTSQTGAIWELYEAIQQTNFFSHNDIMALTHDNMVGTSYNFDQAFGSIIAYLHQELAKVEV